MHTGTLFQIVVIGALSVALAVCVNVFRPDPLPWVEDWTGKRLAAYDPGTTLAPRDAIAAWERDTLFVDVRTPVQFADGHVPNAINVPYDPFDFGFEAAALAAIPRDVPVILYCDSISCTKSKEMAEFLAFSGYNNVLVMPDGLVGWQEADGPLTDGAEGQGGSAQ